MDKREELQTKKLKNKIIDMIRKVDTIFLIKIAKMLGVPVQLDLIKKYDSHKKD